MRFPRYGLTAFPALSLLTSATATAQMIGEPSATAIAADHCVAAWARAAASVSCTTTVLNAESHPPGGDVINDCAVKANCASRPGGDHDSFSDYHGGPAGVQTLTNCNGALSTGC